MTATDTAPATTADQLLEIPVGSIFPSDDNPRVDLGDIADMAESIRMIGVIEPLIVRPGPTSGYTLIAGERRLTAATEAGLATVPCIVRDITDDRALEQTIVENLHRKDLNPVEEARGYLSLVEQFGLSQRDIAARVFRSQAHISHRLALLKLPPEVLDELAADKPRLTVEQATLLATFHGAPARMARLVELLGSSRFEQVLAAELGEYKREQKREKAVADLEERGVPIVLTYSWQDTLDQGLLDVDPEAHAAEPCHAACVNFDGRVVLLCTDRARHAPDGDSTLKASNMTPSDDEEDTPRPSSSDAPPSAGAAPSRPAGAAEQGAPAGDRPPRPPSPAELERQANLTRRDAYAATTAPRRQRMADYLANAKPAKGDVVKLLAGQLCDDDWTYQVGPEVATLLGLGAGEAEPVDWATVDQQEVHDALAAYVAKNDVHATKFLLAFALELVEDGLTYHARHFNGVAPGALADEAQVVRHYEFLRDIGWQPTDVERELLEPPPAETSPTDDAPAAAATPSSADNGVIAGVELTEILDALANLKVAFYAGVDDEDLDEQRFVDAAEAQAIESSGLGHRLHRIEITDVDDDGPTGAELVPWETLDDFDRSGSDAVVGGTDDDLLADEVDGEAAIDAGDPPQDDLDPLDLIELRWKAFDTAVLAAKAAGGKQPLHVARDIHALRWAFADAVAAPHSDPAEAARALSVIFADHRQDLDTNGPINPAKNGPDDLHRFQPYVDRLLEVVEEGDALLPAELRQLVVDLDGFSFNSREGCPAGHLFPRLRVEDLIDAYTRRVEG